MSWLPTQITSLIGWYDGTDPAGTGTPPADGSEVTTWVDKSNRTNDATAGAGFGPTYTASAINSTAALLFNPANSERMTLGANPFVGGGGSFLAVFKKTTDTPASSSYTGAIFYGPKSHSSQSHFPWTDGSIYEGFGTSSRKTPGNPTKALTDAGIYSVQSSQSNYEVMFDGSSFYSTTSNDAEFGGTGNTAYIGGNSNDFYEGYIGELLVFKTWLTTEERQKAEGYLAHKWGLTALLPAGHPYASSAPTSGTAHTGIPFLDHTYGYTEGDGATNLTISSFAPGTLTTSGRKLLVTIAVEGQNDITAPTFGGVTMNAIHGLDATTTGTQPHGFYYLDEADWPTTPADIVFTGSAAGDRMMMAATLHGAATGAPHADNWGAHAADPISVSVTTTEANTLVVDGFTAGNNTINGDGAGQTQLFNDPGDAAITVAIGMSAKSASAAAAHSMWWDQSSSNRQQLSVAAFLAAPEGGVTTTVEPGANSVLLIGSQAAVGDSIPNIIGTPSNTSGSVASTSIAYGPVTAPLGPNRKFLLWLAAEGHSGTTTAPTWDGVSMNLAVQQGVSHSDGTRRDGWLYYLDEADWADTSGTINWSDSDTVYRQMAWAFVQDINPGAPDHTAVSFTNGDNVFKSATVTNPNSYVAHGLFAGEDGTFSATTSTSGDVLTQASQDVRSSIALGGVLDTNGSDSYADYTHTDASAKIIMAMAVWSPSSAGVTTTVEPGVGAVLLTGASASVTVTDHKEAAPGSSALLLNGQAASVSTTDHKWSEPGVGSLTLTGIAAGVEFIQRYAPGTGALLLTGAQADIALELRVQPGVGAVTLTGQTATVDYTGHYWAEPGAGAVVLTGQQVSLVETSSNPQPGTAALTLTGGQPNLYFGTVISPDTAALELTGQQVRWTLATAPAAGSVTLTGGTLTLTLAVAPAVSDVVLTGTAVDIELSTTVTIEGFAVTMGLQEPVVWGLPDEGTATWTPVGEATATWTSITPGTATWTPVKE